MELPPALVQPGDQPRSHPTDDLIMARERGAPFDPDTFLNLLLQLFVVEKIPWKEVESPHFRNLIILANPQCERHIPSAKQLKELHEMHELAAARKGNRGED